MITAPLSLPRSTLVLIILLISFLTMDSLGDRKLANPDEGRYSEIAREMAASNDFITPRLNGLKYFEKPPLQYWATAISFKLLGESEFSARLYTALCGLACVLLMAYVGWKVFDAETGLLAALVLLSAPYFAGMTEVITLDMGLTFWLTLALASFMLAQVSSPDTSPRKWLWLAWVGMAGAVLSKGLIGIVFPAAALFLYCLVQRDFRPLLKLEWIIGLIIFFAICTPWFVLVSLENPEFPQFFFIHEHFERFLSTTHRREQAWWFFLPILFGGFLPWAVALIPAMWWGWKQPGQLTSGAMIADSKAFRPLRFILLYSAFIFLFFSRSGSKLTAYILPFFPLMALLIGAYIRNADPKRLAWLVLPIFPFALWGIYAAWQAPMKRATNDFSRPLYDELSVWVMIAAAVIATGALTASFVLRKYRKWTAVLALSVTVMIGIEFIERGYEKISPLQSGFGLAQSINKHVTPDTRLYSVKTYDQSAPFYLKRTLTLVEYVDEFEMGQKREPEKFIANLKDFPVAWNAPGAAIAIIQPNAMDEMKALGLDFDVIHQDPRRAAIKKTIEKK
jgi:4-amino-4-deoxy-L-arabinose transferase-like glycosyltransferase